MEDFFDQQKTTAFVYLLSDHDEKNKVLISDDLMLVIRKGLRKTIPLRDIAKLKIENKKLLLPLILGGIIAPFAFISYFVNIFLPWYHLIATLVGMYFFYLGWSGRISMTICFKNGDELHYFLPSASNNLHAFIDYLNSILRNRKGFGEFQYLFFIIPKRYVDYLFGKNAEIKEDLFPLFGYTFDQIRNQKNLPKTYELVMINPEKAGREIKFEYDISTSKMRPKLEGPVSEASREEISFF